MKKTITQVFKSFEDYVSKNLVLKQFIANVEKRNVSNNFLYPALFATIENAKIDLSVTTVNVNLYFLDLPNKDQDYVKKLSDMLTVTTDFMTTFELNEYTYGFNLSPSSDAQPIGQKINEDECIGWLMPIQVLIDNSNDESEVPIQ